MYTQWFDPELVRFAFLLGILVATLFYERFQITCGSVVIPGYLGMAWPEPQLIVSTLGTALLVYLAVHPGLARVAILSRSGKFQLAVFLGALLQALAIGGTALHGAPSDPLWTGLGYVIPGLIAHDMARQGPWKSVGAIAATGSVVAAFLALALFVLPESRSTGIVLASDGLAFDSRFLPIAVLAGVVASTGLQRNHGLRSGGFIGAAYLSEIVTRPTELCTIALFTAVSWFVVVFVLKPRLMLFGRRKFAAMLIVGGLVSWCGSSLGARWLPPHWFDGFTTGHAVMSVFLPALFANDIDRCGLLGTLRGTLLGMACSLGAALTAVEAFGPARIEVLGPLAAVTVAVCAWCYVRDLRALALRLCAGPDFLRLRQALDVRPSKLAAARGGIRWQHLDVAAALLLVAIAAVRIYGDPTGAHAGGRTARSDSPPSRIETFPALLGPHRLGAQR